jgi:hypothetical protein
MSQCTITIKERNYLVSDNGEIVRLPSPFRPNALLLKPSKTAHGYLRLCLKGCHKFVHQIVYEAFNGEIPVNMDIDHINGIRDDNRLQNLRVCTRKENALNRKQANRNNAVGVRGVYFHKSSGSWCFAVCGKQIFSSISKNKVISYAKEYHAGV